jgi:hypothetical protein
MKSTVGSSIQSSIPKGSDEDTARPSDLPWNIDVETIEIEMTINSRQKQQQQQKKGL